MEEERQWIEEVLSGNKQAYAQIIDKYKNPLYATILRMTKNQQDAVDLVQESFIKIYRQLGKFDGKGSFSSWLYRVAINHCMDEFRKKRLKMEQVEIREEDVKDLQHPEVIFLKKEKNRQLDLAIKGKNVSDKVIYELDDLLNEVYPIPYFIDILHFEKMNNEALIEHINREGKQLYRKDSTENPVKKPIIE